MVEKELWLEKLSTWMEEKGAPDSTDEMLLDLMNQWGQASWEADSLFQTSESLEAAYSKVVDKMQNELI